MFTVG